MSRLVLHGSRPGFSLEIDGKPVTCVSRVELIVDAKDGAQAVLTIPAMALDVDVDARAFVASLQPPEES